MIRPLTLLILAVVLVGCACPSPGSSQDRPETSAAKPKKKKSFRARLDARIDRLVKEPRIEVVTAYYGPGVSKKALARFEKRHGAKLPRDVKRFYREVGQVQVFWRCHRNGTFTKRPDSKRKHDGYAPDQGFHGLIDITPAEEVFVTGNYEDDLWFPGDAELNTQTLDGREIHRKHLRRFDNQDHYSQVALLVEPGARKMPVVVGGDYFAEVAPKSLRLRRYLDLVVDNVGYQGDTHSGACKGLDKKLGLRNPYKVKRPLYLDYTDR